MAEDRLEDGRANEDPEDRAVAALARTLAKAGAVDDVPISEEQLVKVEAGVRSLRRRDREIFIAHRRDGMNYAAIAAATGLSVAQVKRGMARAIFGIDRHLRGVLSRRWWWPF